MTVGVAVADLTPEQRALRERWVAELRSGKYKQTKNVLHRIEKTPFQSEPIGYCCLGVACQMLVVDGKLVKEIDGSIVRYKADSAPYHAESSFLPDAAAEALGMTSAGEFNIPPADLSDIYATMGREAVIAIMDSNQHRASSGKIRISLAGLNDKGLSFTGIADFIERYFL